MEAIRPVVQVYYSDEQHSKSPWSYLAQRLKRNHSSRLVDCTTGSAPGGIEVVDELGYYISPVVSWDCASE